MPKIPQFLQNFRVYNGKNALLGVEADLTLPKFENISETVSGAGLLGEFETPVPGAFKSQTVEVGFRVIDSDMFTIASKAGSLTFRGSQQFNDYSNNEGIIDQAIRIETRGDIKSIDLGKAAPGKATDSKLTQEVIFIAIYIDNKEVLYLDKLNFIYRLNGKDMTAGIAANL
jgi:uncharacterized protein